VKRGGLLVLAAALAACGLPASAQAQVSPAQAQALGREAYRYGLPLLDFLRIRREMTSVNAPDGRGNAPVNVLANARAFASPSDRTVVAPNHDTLYSLAQLDLAKGPIVLSHPDMGRRYFDFEFVDPYTNVIGYVGTRTTGTQAARFQIAWTKKPGKRLRGVPVISSNHRRVWMIGRTLATDAPADQRRAHAKMRRYRLSPAPALRSSRPGKPRKHPLPKDGLSWLDALGKALVENPPPKRDRPLLRRLKRVGVGVGLTPVSRGLPADVLQALVEGVEAEAAELPGSTRIDVLRQALENGGWLTLSPRIGAYGTDYLLRAQVAIVGIGANTPAEAIYPTALADSTGALLTGANRYRMVFAPGQLPPVRGFWSITMYDFDGFLVPNAAHRYSLGPTHPPLVRRGDGSLVIAIQRTRPAEQDVNWLPSPAGGFRLSMRLYWPRPSVLHGAWRPPPLERLPPLESAP
jgi:hypothetical protein